MRSKVSWLALAALVVGLIAARFLLAGTFEPRQVLAFFRESSSQPWAIPLFILAYLVGTTALLPAVGFHIVAGLVWGFGPGVLVSQLALNLVSNLHFAVGRWLGQARVKAWLARRGWTRAETLFAENGLWSMVAVRQLPLPFVAVNVSAGASPVKWPHFLVGSALGALGPTIVYTYFATSLIDGVEGAKKEAVIKALLAGAAIVLLAVGPKLFQWWRKRSKGQATSPT